MQRVVNINILIIYIFLMTGCAANNTYPPQPSNILCGPANLVISPKNNTGYAIGYRQLLNVDSTGNIIFTLPFPYIGSGLWMDTMDISAKTNDIWVAGNDGSGPNILTILDSNGTILTQKTTNISTITSVKLSKITGIGWIAGVSNTEPAMLEALDTDITSLVSFTIPSLNTYNPEPIKLAISPVDGTVWAWSDGELSGFTITGMSFGPYPVNIYETTGASYRKQIIVNPITGDIWIGSPATSTVVAYFTNGTIRFQEDTGINVYTMAVSSKTGDVWIGNLNRAVVLDSSGNIIKQFSFKDISHITVISISPVNNNIWIGNAIKAGTKDDNFFILDNTGTILRSFQIYISCMFLS